MTTIQVARLVVETKSAHVFRERGAPDAIDAMFQYDAKPWHTGGHRGWTILDLFTANAIVTVYDALNDGNRRLCDGIRLPMLARVCFKLLAAAPVRP